MFYKLARTITDIMEQRFHVDEMRLLPCSDSKKLASFPSGSLSAPLGPSDCAYDDSQSSPVSEKGGRLSTLVSASDRRLFTGGRISLKVAP
jgi:hypothetical protein